MADPKPVGDSMLQIAAMPAREGIATPLPTPLTGFVGREADKAAVAALLRERAVRLLTLTGPGGVGKTRLAIEVVRSVAGDFRDGACFVALAPIRDAALVPAAVVAALAIPEQGDQSALHTLAGALRKRQLLLVLDNFEHLLGEPPSWLAELLVTCPGLNILVTSRTVLHLEGEQRYVVAPLPVPAPESGSGATDADALRLFAQRARAVDTGFVLDETNAGTVAAICGMLDGLPLAIELAAARIGVLTPEALLSRLTARLRLLTGGQRDVPARLRSMSDAIGWSYDLLAPDEQAAFRRLSVFLDGFTLEAAAFVLPWPVPPVADVDVLETVQSLVEQSLLPRARDAGDRFRMLETIREFGLQVAADAGDLDDACRAHAAYYIDLAVRVEPELRGPALPRWLDRLEADYPNLLAAMDWLETHDRLADAVGIRSRVAYFLEVRGFEVEHMARLERWHAHPALGDHGQARGLALQMWGNHLAQRGDFVGARQPLATAATLLQDAGDRWHEAQARTMLAGVLHDLDGPDAARHQCEAALEAARAAGNQRLVSMNLNNLASAAEADGDPERAITLRAEAAAVARETGDPWARAHQLSQLAWKALCEGAIDDAEGMAEELRHLLESYRSQRELPVACELLAWIARARGDLDRAAERVAAGLAIAERGRKTWKSGNLLFALGIIATERDDIARAVDALATRLRMLDPAQHPVDTALALDAWAWLAARAGDSDQAARFHGGAVRVLRDAGADDPPPFDVDVAGLRVALRDRLGVDRMARAAADGGAVPVAIVIAEALAYAPPVPANAEARDPFGLTPREREVLRLVATGMTDRQIADALYISRRTAEWHVRNVIGKLGVANRAEAASRAVREGLR